MQQFALDYFTEAYLPTSYDYVLYINDNIYKTLRITKVPKIYKNILHCFSTLLKLTKRESKSTYSKQFDDEQKSMAFEQQFVSAVICLHT